MIHDNNVSQISDSSCYSYFMSRTSQSRDELIFTFTLLHSNSKFNNEYVIWYMAVNEEILADVLILSVGPWPYPFVFTSQAVQDGMLSCNLGYFGHRCLTFAEFDAEMFGES